MAECELCHTYIHATAWMDRHQKSNKCKNLRKNYILKQELDKREKKLENRIKLTNDGIKKYEKAMNDYFNNLDGRIEEIYDLMIMMAKQQGMNYKKKEIFNTYPKFWHYIPTDNDDEPKIEFLQTDKSSKIVEKTPPIKVEFLDKNKNPIKVEFLDKEKIPIEVKIPIKKEKTPIKKEIKKEKTPIKEIPTKKTPIKIIKTKMEDILEEETCDEETEVELEDSEEDNED